MVRTDALISGVTFWYVKMEFSVIKLHFSRLRRFRKFHDFFESKPARKAKSREPVARKKYVSLREKRAAKAKFRESVSNHKQEYGIYQPVN